MRSLIILFQFTLFAFFVCAQNNSRWGKCTISMKNSSSVKEADIWKIHANKIEYMKNGSLHDVMKDQVERIETSDSIITFRSDGKMFGQPYDLIIRAGGDTVKCRLAQVSNSFIYFYERGKDKRQYLPGGSVVSYKQNNPLPMEENIYSETPQQPVAKQDSSTRAEVPAVALDNPPHQSDSSNLQPDSTLPTVSLPADSSKVQQIPAEVSLTLNPTQPERVTEQSKLNCQESYLLGETNAKENVNTWILGGFGGFCCGCIPALSYWTTSAAAPLTYPEKADIQCYQWGYEKQVIKMRSQGIVMGGIVSIGLVGAFYYFLFTGMR